METDSSYEDHSQVEGEESSLDDDSEASLRPHQNIMKRPVLTFPDSRKGNITESNDEHWQRLQDHYSDQYLNLFNESCIDGIDKGKLDLDSTQVGVTIWSTLEKENFFHALSRRSKAGVRDIAESIGTKSELEVYHYLRLLEDEDRNRHLYVGNVNNVKFAEIPAAAEMSSECEALLEKAADALGVYQDRFDHAVGEQTHPEGWLIDYAKAKAHDGLVDDAECANSSQGNGSSPSSISPSSLFKLSSWLSLSERLFMNSGSSCRTSNRGIHVAQDEVPAITQGAIYDLYELALYQLRKMMQTSIFCAHSRIRSTNEGAYTVKRLVKDHDVAAAINVLGFQEGASEFWIKLARRNHLKVVDDHHKGAGSEGTMLQYDELERILKESSGPRARRRSASSASESSLVPGTLDHTEESSISNGTDDTDRPMLDQPAGQQSQKQDCRSRSPLLYGDEGWSTDGTHEAHADAKLDPTSSDEDGISFVSEEDEDSHLETFDQINSRRQEILLYRELDWPVPEDAELGHCEELQALEQVLRTTERKAKTDLCGWRDAISGYSESWEKCGDLIDEIKFAENRRRSKRRKIEQATGEQQDLPFRAPTKRNH